jgi:DNA primase
MLIDQIKSSLNILEVARKLGLRVTNGNFVHSIYKSERTPSLKLYPETNSFYCFATNKGGDLIKFWADARKISNGEGVKELAEMLNLGNDFHLRKSENHFPETLAIKKEKEIVLLGSEREVFEERSSIIQFEGNKTREEAETISQKFIIEQREKTQVQIYQALSDFCLKEGINKEALSYLKNERCLNDSTIENFKLFAINDVDKTIRFLKSNFSKDQLLISGLFTQKNFFIFSHHQIVVPYIQGGQIKYLRARYFNKGNSKPENNFGKYIGLSNSIAGNLGSRRFFNFDLLKRLNPNESLIIHEGEFDSMLATQFGFNSIGIAGVGNFPKDEGTISLLKNFDLFLFFDSDEAGQKAVKEIGKFFASKRIHSVALKNYKDFTELVRNGKYKL